MLLFAGAPVAGPWARKRPSEDGDARKQPQQPRKRAKGSDPSAASRRSTRSRSASSRRQKEEEDRRAALRRSRVVEVVPAPAADGRVVPADFGLVRDSFDDGRSGFTYGIAHYDAPQRDDPQRCKGYVTDMFQHLYHAEVRRRTQRSFRTDRVLRPRTP